MRRSNRWCSFVIGTALAVGSFLCVPERSWAVSSYEPECEGNACAAITMTWDQERQQFKVANSSGQQVKVTVSTFAGDSSIIVLPHKENYLEAKTFNGPFKAEFD